MSASIVLIATVTIRPGQDEAFTDWQVRHEAALAKFPGFVSTDITPAGEPGGRKWVIILNFDTKEHLAVWQESGERAVLVAEISRFAEKNDVGLVLPIEARESQAIITEVILSKVLPGREEAYRAWTTRIQMAQAKYPGYRGMYLQPPSSDTGGHWTTLLRFDTMEHLLAWKSAPERMALLEEAKDIIESEELMRLSTAFPGWVPIDPATGKGPPNWKTAMLILLGLYPTVVLEMRFLNPYLEFLNLSLATFFCNVLSVSVTTFLTMPFFVRWFGWWLFPDQKAVGQSGMLGVAILILLFAVEIALLWQIFPG